MVFTDFLSWWYGAGWRWAVRRIGAHAREWMSQFSFPIILRTLFSPWKQLVSQPKNQAGLQAKFSALIDNLISRLVGATVRSTVLVLGLLFVLVNLILNAAIALVWPLLPIAPIALVIAGVSL